MPITNETELRQAIYTLPSEGGVVEFEGTISITSTLLLGNGSDIQRSDFNGITLRGKGSGVTEMDMGIGRSSAPSKLIWEGPPGGTMIQIAGPISGVRVLDFQLDGNNLAATGIDSIRSFNNIVDNIIIRKWTNGYAMKVRANTLFNGHGMGGGGAPHHSRYSMIYMTDPGAGGNGLQIAPETGNVNQIVFNRVTAHYSSEPECIGLDLGFMDHISFYSCYFGRVNNGVTGIVGNSIQVSPISSPVGYNNWPQNVYFYDTPITGGIKLNPASPVWVKRANAALNFFPYYTADGQVLPPLSSEGDLLPVGMVSGITDQGERIGYLARGENRLMFSRQVSSNSAANQTTDYTLFNQSGEIYAEYLQAGAILRLKAGGRVTKPGTNYQVIEIRFFIDGVLASSAHLEISNTHDGYLWEAESELVVLSRSDEQNQIVLRRNGGKLALAFVNNGTAWTPGIISVYPSTTTKKVKLEVSAKWWQTTPSGCSIVMDSLMGKLIQS